jgi:hypothetical protein
MRSKIGAILAVLSLPLVVLGAYGIAPVTTFGAAFGLVVAGSIMILLGRDDRRRDTLMSAILAERERLAVVPKPPPPPVTTEPEAFLEAPPRRPATMLPPAMSPGEARRGIRLVHTDGRRLVLRNRPKKTGSDDE